MNIWTIRSFDADKMSQNSPSNCIWWNIQINLCHYCRQKSDCNCIKYVFKQVWVECHFNVMKAVMLCLWSVNTKTTRKIKSYTNRVRNLGKANENTSPPYESNTYNIINLRSHWLKILWLVAYCCVIENSEIHPFVETKRARQKKYLLKKKYCQ